MLFGLNASQDVVTYNSEIPEAPSFETVPDAPPPAPTAPPVAQDSSKPITSSVKTPQWKIDQALKAEQEAAVAKQKEEEFAKLPTNAKIHVDMIEKYESIKKVEDIVNFSIENSGIKPNEILVVFDFDQTLTGRKIMESGRLVDCSPINNTIINSLNKRGIAWGILSARTISPTTLESIKDEVNEFRDTQGSSVQSRLEGLLQEETRTVYYKGQSQPIRYGILDQLDFASMGGSFSYEKDLALDYLIEKYKSKYFEDHYPKLIIFVDDNAENVLRMRDYFTTGYGRIHDTTVYALVYDPTTRGEQGHQLALDALQPFFKN